MKNTNELKAGAILSYINLAISCIIPLLYTPLMLRILGQSEYGLYSLSNSVISYLSLLNFGMGTAVVRYVTKYKAENNKDYVEKIIGLFLVVYFIFAALVCIVGLGLTFKADVFFGKSLSGSEILKLKTLMIIMTLSTAISFPVSVFSSVSIAYERYIFKRIFDLISTILAPILNLFFLYWGLGSAGLALVGLFMQILYAFGYTRYCSKVLNIRVQFKNLPYIMLKEIWTFSAFVFLSSIVDMLYWATDKVLIGAMIGSIAVAVYNVGGVFNSMLQQMSSAISSVFTPRVTTMVVKETPIGELSALLIRIGRIQYLVVSFVLSGYIVFGQVFIHFWSGDEYLQAYYVALLTMIPLAVPLIQNIAFSTIVAQNKHRFRSVLYACIAVVNLVSTYLVIPKYGIIGAAACTSLAFLFGNGVIMNVYYYKVTKLDIPLFWKNIGKMSKVPFVFSTIGYIAVNWGLPIKGVFFFGVEIVIYSIFYAIVSWRISMNQYERMLFIEVINKCVIRKKRDRCK